VLECKVPAACGSQLGETRAITFILANKRERQQFYWDTVQYEGDEALNIREVFRQTASSIAAHKLRSFLTMFGIIWGITSVILLVGLGRGLAVIRKSASRRLASIWPLSGAGLANRPGDTLLAVPCASPSAMFTR
jgi:hypothetical protein